MNWIVLLYWFGGLALGFALGRYFEWKRKIKGMELIEQQTLMIVKLSTENMRLWAEVLSHRKEGEEWKQ